MKAPAYLRVGWTPESAYPGLNCRALIAERSQERRPLRA
jgi:hypothetical protein